MLKYNNKKYSAEGSKINQIIIALFMVLPIFSYGTAVGWMSPMSPQLMSEDTPASAPVHPDVISWMASVVYIVGTPAVFLLGYIVDNFGRKRALLFTSFALAMCWSLKLFSSEPWALITARAILGVGVSGCYVVTPLYIKEISEDSIRGTLGSLVVLSQNLGNLLVYIIGEYLSYYAVLWICLAVPLLHLLVFTVMPETPSYLLKCGKVEEARHALAWLRRKQDGDVDDELQKLLVELEQNKSERFWPTLKSLVSDSNTFKAFRITVIITVARELCGCLAVLHFASLIFEKASGSWVLSANQQATVLGVVQFVGSCTASSLVERTGRKLLLATTALVSGVAMATLGTWFYINQTWSGLYWLPIASLCLCIYCDAAGLQPVPFVIMTEMFNFQFRGTVTSLVMSFACFLTSVQLRVFHPIATFFGLHVVFWIFSAVCIISTVYIVRCVPETKMKSIDEIYAQIEGKHKGKHEENIITKL